MNANLVLIICIHGLQLSNNLIFFFFTMKLNGKWSQYNTSLLTNILCVGKWLTLLSSSFRVRWEGNNVSVADSQTMFLFISSWRTCVGCLRWMEHQPIWPERSSRSPAWGSRASLPSWQDCRRRLTFYFIHQVFILWMYQDWFPKQQYLIKPCEIQSQPRLS